MDVFSASIRLGATTVQQCSVAPQYDRDGDADASSDGWSLISYLHFPSLVCVLPHDARVRFALS